MTLDEIDEEKKEVGKDAVKRILLYSAAGVASIPTYDGKVGSAAVKSVNRANLANKKEAIAKQEKEWQQKMDTAKKYYDKISPKVNNIASDVVNGMISDLERWGELPKGKSKAEIKASLLKKVSAQINDNIKDNMTYGTDNIYEFNNGDMSFGIDGFEEYSDYAPLTIEIDKNGKLKDFYYT